MRAERDDATVFHDRNSIRVSYRREAMRNHRSLIERYILSKSPLPPSAVLSVGKGAAEYSGPGVRSSRIKAAGLSHL